MTRYLRNNSPAKLFQLRITVSGRNDLRIREKNRDETVYIHPFVTMAYATPLAHISHV